MVEGTHLMISLSLSPPPSLRQSSQWISSRSIKWCWELSRSHITHGDVKGAFRYFNSPASRLFFQQWPIDSPHKWPVMRKPFRCYNICMNIRMTSKWARWRLKSPASRLFIQAFIQAQIKENIKAPPHWPVNSPHKGPVTWNFFPFDDAIMNTEPTDGPAPYDHRRVPGTLQWRHNESDSVSNHQPHHCFLNRLFRHKSKKTSKFRLNLLIPFWWRRHQNMSLSTGSR